MMTEWTDVADSAIKIGLGALIGGGFAIWLQVIKDRSSLTIESFKRRREIIEDVSSKFGAFNMHLSHFWAALKNALYKKNNDSLEKSDEEELKEFEKNIYNQFAEVAILGNKLLLLGEENVVEILDDYVNDARDFFKVANLNNSKLNDELMDKYKIEFIEKRKKVLGGLHSAFDKQA